MTTSGRVLLADDSPHAQRMGERILREEGFEVVTVTDGETAIIRLKDVDPDVVIVDAFLPQVSGYDLCGFIKKQPQHSHVRVLLTSTALERVDEDQAYKVGADGQLKKPFEASVMLKSLKDLIGGSDKKKRAGTTLDLSYSGGETPDKAENAAPIPDAEDASGEKPVSALQAWLQQHDSGTYAGAAAPEAPVVEEPANRASAAAVGGLEEVREEDARLISNPQLLRRAEEEPEDLSLRNNPVAKLRYGSKAAAPEARQPGPAAEPAPSADVLKGGVRSFRIQPVAAPPAEPEAAPAEPARPPRKSLLEQLEEFEKASTDGAEISATTPFSKAPPAPVEKVPAEEAPVAEAPVKSSLEKEVEAALAEQAELEAQSAVASAGESTDADAGQADEFLAMRTRKGRAERPSLRESMDSAVEEEAAGETAAVGVADEIAGEAVAVMAVAEVATEVATEVESAVEQSTVVSLASAGVRLDEEEVRAVIEIAVSAAMPTIVEEVSRCVLLALQSRYEDKAMQNGDHSAE